MAQHNITLYHTILILHYTILHYTVLHSIILYYIILYKSEATEQGVFASGACFGERSCCLPIGRLRSHKGKKKTKSRTEATAVMKLAVWLLRNCSLALCKAGNYSMPNTGQTPKVHNMGIRWDGRPRLRGQILLFAAQSLCSEIKSVSSRHLDTAALSWQRPVSV